MMTSPAERYISFIQKRMRFYERDLAMPNGKGWHGSADYQIIVKARLESRWSGWFEGMTIEAEGAVTIIEGRVLDQSALHGLLVRIRDLGLPLISVKRVESGQKAYK